MVLMNFFISVSETKDYRTCEINHRFRLTQFQLHNTKTNRRHCHGKPTQPSSRQYLWRLLLIAPKQ